MFLTREIAKFQHYMQAQNYSNRTVKDYRSQLGFFKRYLESEGIKSLNEIDRETIHKYQMSLLSCEPIISLETQYSRIVPVKSLFRYLTKTNQTLYDPASDIELPKRKRNLPRDIMTKKEVLRVLNKPDVDTPLGLRDKAILELLYSTGIRNQELREINIYDVNIHDGLLRIEQGKGRKDRIVPLGDLASNCIDEYLQHGRHKLLNDNKINVLFISKYGKKLGSNDLIWMVKKYCREAKLKKHITPHSFRHTCATHLLKNKASLRHIQQLLGHASMETTQIYTKIEVSDLKKEHKRCHPRERD